MVFFVFRCFLLALLHAYRWLLRFALCLLGVPPGCHGGWGCWNLIANWEGARSRTHGASRLALALLAPELPILAPTGGWSWSVRAECTPLSCQRTQNRTKRNPHLSVAKWRCLGVVPKDGLRGHSALDLICDPCVGRLCSSSMISGVLRCLCALLVHRGPS